MKSQKKGILRIIIDRPTRGPELLGSLFSLIMRVLHAHAYFHQGSPTQRNTSSNTTYITSFQKSQYYYNDIHTSNYVECVKKVDIKSPIDF
jgi:hypothetical protein